MEWRHLTSLVNVKPKQTLSRHKIMATVFWDWLEFMPRGETINALAYCATMANLRRAIQNKFFMTTPDHTLLVKVRT